MTTFAKSVFALGAVAVLCLSAIAAERPNVLMIAVDDLRPELNVYGRTHITSPNIDSLAASGVLFERAYCMVPTCGASRASLMTSIRPARDRFVSHLARADKEAPGITTLNTHFKNNGYYTVSLGKIFHIPEDNAEGWSEKPWRPSGGTTYALEENARPQEGYERGTAFEFADVPDTTYGDGILAERALEDLRRLSAMDQPFFLAVGFFKPHLPFVAPQRYWDLYDPATIALPDNYWPPEDAPDGAVHSFGELRTYSGIPKQGLLDEELAKSLIRGYYACVSYTDALIGRILGELEALGLEENTIVLLWGDHGWNLGEHTMWCKHSCFEVSMHAPLIVRAPDIAAGAKTPVLTEFIDIYPTLCDLAGLPKPEHLQGQSFLPVLHDPAAPHKEFAIGRFGPGDSIRTDDFRYSMYTRSGELTGRMLYDHNVDPDENKNVAGNPELGPTVERLHQTLVEHMGKPTVE